MATFRLQRLKKKLKARNFSVFWRFFQKFKFKSWMFVLVWRLSYNLISKQETIQKSNEKPTVPTQGQNYSKVTLHTKTFSTMPIMWRLVGGNPVFWGDKGEATKWKIFINRLIPGQRHKRAFNKMDTQKMDTFWWKVWLEHLIKIGHFWQKKDSSKIDIKNRNEHSSYFRTARKLNFCYDADWR
jgi:hypothetical protein